jgi:acetyl-CoA C-acetyltransferase
MVRLSREVGIIGIGQTKFGENWDLSFRELGIQAGIKAIKDAGIESKVIDSLYIGNMSSGLFMDQEHIASMITEEVGLTGRHVPATRVEAADASGALALRQAIFEISSGHSDVVIVGGAEKMTDVTSDIASDFIMAGADRAWEGLFGASLASLFALMARKHMIDFGTTREQIAQVAVKNHFNGARNPFAQFQKEIDIGTVLNAGPIADPLGVFDCFPVSDGAAALVLCDMKTAKEYCDEPVMISGTGQGSDTLAISNRKDITTIRSTVTAAHRAYQMAGIKPEEIDVAEVHDSYTIAEILAIEDLGFFKKGEGGIATENGETSLSGSKPVNTSGGLKARGHPFGATGIAQINEIVLQLRKKAEGRQVKDATKGLAHNMGGTGGTSLVHILEVV